MQQFVANTENYGQAQYTRMVLVFLNTEISFGWWGGWGLTSVYGTLTTEILQSIIHLCCKKTYGEMKNYNDGDDYRDNDGNKDRNNNDNAASGSVSYEKM